MIGLLTRNTTLQCIKLADRGKLILGYNRPVALMAPLLRLDGLQSLARELGKTLVNSARKFLSEIGSRSAPKDWLPLGGLAHQILLNRVYFRLTSQTSLWHPSGAAGRPCPLNLISLGLVMLIPRSQCQQ